jgi:MSHA pilin protein MshC
MEARKVRSLSFSRGFSLPELITVMVVAGILAAVAIPRWFGSTGFAERGLRDETQAALRYAQKSAVAARRLVCVQFSANGLTATMATNFGASDCAGGGALVGPSGQALTVSSSGASFKTPPSAPLTFSPLGQPSARTEIEVNGLPTALNIVVEAETGYVH